MKTKESFLLYKDSLNVLDHLDNEQAGKLFKAIAAHQKGDEVEVDPIIKIALSPFLDHFIRDDKKYNAICEKRSKAGSKGGTKTQQANALKDKQNKQMLEPSNKTKQSQANQADSDPDLVPEPEPEPDPEPERLKDLPTKVGGVTQSNSPYEVFSYWCKAMKKDLNTSKLTPKREKAIKARINEGYTVGQIKTAIDGCSNDPWSMGSNDRQKPFNDIELICRTGEKLESYIELLKQPTTHKSKNVDLLMGLDLDA